MCFVYMGLIHAIPVDKIADHLSELDIKTNSNSKFGVGRMKKFGVLCKPKSLAFISMGG